MRCHLRISARAAGVDAPDRAGASISSSSSRLGRFYSRGHRQKNELDALRFEMGLVQQRAEMTERDLAIYMHDVGMLCAEKNHLANQVHELLVALSTAHRERDSAEFELNILKEAHDQGMQESRRREQALMQQVKELEHLLGTQQNSLDEADEHYRGLEHERDELYHAALAAKAQLVMATSQREEMLESLTALTSRTHSKTEKMEALKAAALHAHSSLEVAQGRLSDLEARVTLLQEENLELSTELSGTAELRRQLAVQLSEASGALEALSELNNELMSELTTLRSNQGSGLLSRWRKGSMAAAAGGDVITTATSTTIKQDRDQDDDDDDEEEEEEEEETTGQQPKAVESTTMADMQQQLSRFITRLAPKMQ